MLQRDQSIVQAIHAERAESLLAEPAAGRNRTVGPRASGIRRALGQGFMRLGVWLGGDPAELEKPRSRVPSSA